jgi:hypothetical protein
VAFDPHGNLLIADSNNQRVRVVAVRSGLFYGRHMIAGDVYTIAGTGVAGFSGDGGPATKAELFTPSAVWADARGDLYVDVFDSNRVRVVAGRSGMLFGRPVQAGDVYTVAGDGNDLPSGNGGPATSAGMSPQGVTTDPAGNLILTSDQQVRIVAVRTGAFYGQAMTAGDIYPLAGTGQFGLAGIGGPALQATIGNPAGITTDRSGNVVFAGGGVVWVVAASTGTFYGQAMTEGDIYIVAGLGSADLGDGGPATAAGLIPTSVAARPGGGLLVNDAFNVRVRAISP